MSLAPFTIRFEIALDGSTATTEPSAITWTDVTAADVLQSAPVTWRRGRSKVTDAFSAGGFSYKLDNSGRDYDPSYAAGPHYGALRPGVPARLVAVHDGLVEYPLSFGYVDGWPQDHDLGNTFATVAITATDAFGQLARARLADTVLETEILADEPRAFYKLDETSGTVMIDSSGNGYDGDYTPGTTSLSTTFDVGGVSYRGIQWDGLGHHGRAARAVLPATFNTWTVEAVVVMPEDMTGSDPGNILSHAIQRFYDATVAVAPEQTDKLAIALDPQSATTAKVAGGATSGTTIPLSTSAYDFSTARHVAYSFQYGIGSAIFVDGDEVAAAGSLTWPDPSSDDVTLIGGFENGSKLITALIAIYDVELSDARLAAHGEALASAWDNDDSGARIARVLDERDWPTELRNLDEGRAVLGPTALGGFALDYMQTVAATEAGRFFVDGQGRITLQNRHHASNNARGSSVVVTLSDDGNDVPYAAFGVDYSSDLVLNVVTVTRQGGLPQTHRDEASVALYGEYGGSVSTIHRTDREAADHAKFLADQLSTPVERLGRIVLLPRTPEALYATSDTHALTTEDGDTLTTEDGDVLVMEIDESVLGLEIGDRIQVERTPQGIGAQSTYIEFIEGISASVQAGDWRIELSLSPVLGVEESPWILGTSELATDTTLTF